MIQQIYYILAISVLVILLMFYGKFLISPLLYGVFFAILLMPLINFFVKYLKYYALGFLAAIISVFTVVGIPVFMFYVQVKQFSFIENIENISTSKLIGYWLYRNNNQ